MAEHSDQAASVTKAEQNISPFEGFAQRQINLIYENQHVPSSLHHYTSAQGLLGIIQNNCLWFSNAKYMNDGSESIFGVEQAHRAIDTYLEDKPDNEKEAGDALKAEIQTAMLHLQPFIFCMSGKPNLLNQWRDYGRDIVPYSIELDMNQLGDWREMNFPVHLTKVVYDFERQLTLLKGLVEDIYSKTKELLGARSQFDDSEYPLLLQNAAVQFVVLVARFKNKAFESEEEYRAICYRPEIEKHPRKYRTNSLGVLPYYEWKPTVEGKRLPIKSVTVGPSPYAEVSQTALAELLVDHNYGMVETFRSLIPIRR